jgi:hypothetical protein
MTMTTAPTSQMILFMMDGGVRNSCQRLERGLVAGWSGFGSIPTDSSLSVRRHAGHMWGRLAAESVEIPRPCRYRASRRDSWTTLLSTSTNEIVDVGAWCYAPSASSSVRLRRPVRPPPRAPASRRPATRRTAVRTRRRLTPWWSGSDAHASVTTCDPTTLASDANNCGRCGTTVSAALAHEAPVRQCSSPRATPRRSPISRSPQSARTGSPRRLVRSARATSPGARRRRRRDLLVPSLARVRRFVFVHRDRRPVRRASIATMSSR